MLHERTMQYHCFLQGAPKISKRVTFIQALWVNSGKSKHKKLQSGHFPFWKCYIHGAPPKKQYHYFFRGAHKIF